MAPEAVMNAVEMRNVTKRFGRYRANNDISFSVATQSIHALVGENGAGKSTLMKILYGYHIADEGEIFIRGSRAEVTSPADAIALGIGMVHQHFMLIPPLSVTENIILGNEPAGHGLLLGMKGAEHEVRTLSTKYGLVITPDEKISNLSVALQQRVEILKLLYRKADILIFDEPTPVLTPQEVQEFLQNLLHLKNEGKTIILITHKLSEVFAVSDTITVLRHGKVVGSMPTASTTPAEVARLMTGESVETPPVKEAAGIGKPLMTLREVSLRGKNNAPLLEKLNLSLNSGEILGIAGVEGNGQFWLVQVLLGMLAPHGGSVELNLPGGGSLREAISYIPDDRFRYGMIPDFSTEENLIFGRQKELSISSHALLRRRSIASFARELISAYAIHPEDPMHLSKYLSGGNQQRLLIARELTRDTPIILTNQPTRGLDIKATEFVYSSLINERNKGRGIFIISSDLTELLRLSDRIAVMFEGKFTAVLPASATNDQELGEYMMGVKRQTG